MGNADLINDFEAHNEDGIKLSREFSSLIKDFVIKSCGKYDSTQVEYILSSELSCLCCETRILKSINKRKAQSQLTFLD
jgi:hypothetical protein